MKPHTARTKKQKGRAKGDLMGAIQQVSVMLDAMPDNVVRMPRGCVDAFLLIDPTLSIINRQLLDAKAHMATLAALFGLDDPMIEAATMQLAALEKAYADRLAALRRKREEGRTQLRLSHKKDNEFTNAKELKPADVRRAYGENGKKNDVLWLWAFLLLVQAAGSSLKKTGPKLEAA